MNLLSLLSLLDINECNGNYQHLVEQKVLGLAAIKNCSPEFLTLREVISCIEAASIEFSILLVPVLYPGAKPRLISEICADFPKGALV